MRSHRLRQSFCFAAVVVAGLICRSPALLAQQGTPLPENWQQLPASELVEQLEARYDEGTHSYPGVTDIEAVRDRATALFREFNIQQAQTSDFPVITGLYRAAWKKLEESGDLEGIRTALMARQDDWTGRPYIEVREKVALMGWVDCLFEDRAKEAIRWADAGGNINQVFDKDLPLYIQHVIRQPQVIDKGFSVRWEGRLSAPQTGQYTFSISPINVNASYGDYSVKQTTTVSINGQQVLSATPEQWTTQSAPVQLTADELVPIVVETSIESPKLPVGELSAMLYWEGPGVAKAIVPQSRLRLPTTDNAGLRATYSWKAGDQQKTIAQVDPNIEFAWTSGRLTLSGDPSFQRFGSEIFWSKMVDRTFITNLENNPDTKIHPLLVDPASSAESLPVERRQAFLDELLAHSRLLDAINPQQAVGLYKAYRVGAPETALNVFARWARQNADAECGMPYEPQVSGVDLDNRDSYRQLAICITQQLPQHATRLQNEYLVMPDGTCCLPIAYTLAYSYLSRNRLNEWIEILKSKLDDEAMTGDKRVNWLMARAHADEIKDGPAKPYVRVKAYPFGGQVWLDEAMLVVESPATKARIAKELAARNATTQQYDKARELLTAAAGYAPADMVAAVNGWKKSVDDLEAADQKAQADNAVNAKKAYLDKLRVRRERASAAGNTEAVGRFDALINAAENK